MAYESLPSFQRQSLSCAPGRLDWKTQGEKPMRMSRNVAAVAVLALAAAPVILAASGARPGFLDSSCVANAKKLAIGLAGYAQDWDESMPPMANFQDFRSKIYPYVRNTRAFICPVTNLNYSPNLSLSLAKLSQLNSDWSTIPVVKDTQPHPDGKSTVAFLDGHVERGGVSAEDPNVVCLQNARKLTLGLMMYAQDYDEKLPQMNTQAQFKDAVFPYVKSSRTFICPATQLPYKQNAALSGTLVSSYPNPGRVETLRDARPHPDGKTTRAFLDGYVIRR
jgi:prepilin-type processing-associated H-X9-DG protein